MKKIDKTIWITGGGRGIGRAIAELLADRGARVVISSRTQSELDETAETIRENQGQVLAIRCDSTNNRHIDALIKKVQKKWGEIDILINNAGVGIFKKIIELSEDDWDTVMNSNMKSAFLCTQAVLPQMQKRKNGKIINILSVASKKSFYNCAAYCASKQAMLGFTNVLRMEMREHGIQVTGVFPGATATSIWGNADVDYSKMIKPKEVAQIVKGICNDQIDSMIEEIVIRPQQGDL